MGPIGRQQLQVAIMSAMGGSSGLISSNTSPYREPGSDKKRNAGDDVELLR